MKGGTGRHHARAVWCLFSKNRLGHFVIIVKTKQYFNCPVFGRHQTLSPSPAMILARSFVRSSHQNLKLPPLLTDVSKSFKKMIPQRTEEKRRKKKYKQKD